MLVRFPAFRVLLCVGAGVAVSILIVCTGLSNALVGTDGANAGVWAPWSAPAQAQQASDLVQNGTTAADRDRAEKLARAALSRNATLASAYGTLGLIAADRQETRRARALFTYSDILSKRDLATQIWLINDAAQRGYEGQALAHFDAALRSNPSAAPILFPVLISATDDPRLIEPIRDLLTRSPNWRWPFLARLIDEGKSSRNIYGVTRGLLDPGRPEDVGFARALVDRLIAVRAYSLAWQTYRPFAHAVAGIRQPVPRNGNFTNDASGGPFEWSYPVESRAGTGRQVRPDSGGNIALFAGNAEPGDIVARQLILLAPGEYRVEYEASRPDPFTLTFSCADSGGPARYDAGTRTLSVPARGCPALWLSVGIRPDGGIIREDAWIDAIRILRR